MNPVAAPDAFSIWIILAISELESLVSAYIICDMG